MKGDPFKHPHVGMVCVKRNKKITFTLTCVAYTDEASRWCCKETGLCYTNTNKFWRDSGVPLYKGSVRLSGPKVKSPRL